MNDDDTFSFQKTFKKFGIKIVDEKTNTGNFNTEEIDDNDILLKLNVN